PGAGAGDRVRARRPDAAGARPRRGGARAAEQLPRARRPRALLVLRPPAGARQRDNPVAPLDGEQLLVERLCRGAWCRSEFVSEQAAELVVDGECRSDVSTRLERPHQEAVPALAVGLERDERAPAALGGGDL